MQQLAHLPTEWVPEVFVPLHGPMGWQVALCCKWTGDIWKSTWHPDGNNGVTCWWVKVTDNSALLSADGNVWANPYMERANTVLAPGTPPLTCRAGAPPTAGPGPPPGAGAVVPGEAVGGPAGVPGEAVGGPKKALPKAPANKAAARRTDVGKGPGDPHPKVHPKVRSKFH